MQINVSETCKQIMDPAVPHALRLQAILTSGVVIIHNKQSNYLLDDCHDALRRVNAAANVDNPAAADVDLAITRAPDINLPEDMHIHQTSLFPSFDMEPPFKHRRLEVSEDLFLMPSIPERAHERDNGKPTPCSPEPDHLNHNGMHDTFLMDMEIMDAPDLPLEMFDMEMPQGYEEDAAAAAAALDDLAVQMMDGGGDGFQPDAAEQEGALAGKKKPTSSRRRKKATIDALEETLINKQDRLEIRDGWRELCIPRPCKDPSKTSSINLLDVNPATGKWPQMYENIWNVFVQGRAAEAAAAGVQAKKRSRGDQQGDEGLFHGEEMPMPEDPYDPMYDIAAYAPQEEQQDYVFAGLSAERALLRSNSEGLDVEAERLRAVLHGTPGAGGDYKNTMFQLGLTPGSDDPNRASDKFNRRGALRRDSKGGRLSEKSSDRGRDSYRLSDLVEDYQMPDGDLGDMLPAVGEDGEAGGRNTSEFGTRFSQYSLLEESGPSMPLMMPSVPTESLHTLEVLASARSLVESPELSIYQATNGLSRLEAAKFFLHVLVGVTKKFIGAEQEEPYGDITIHFAA